MSTGTETELLSIRGVQLYLLDDVESVRMGTGDFALIMMVQATTPLATLVAQVAEFQWPIGKDAPVLKIGVLRYTFSMPGLVYGLILPDETSFEQVQIFEACLRQYCTFEVCPEIANTAVMNDSRLWSFVRRSSYADGAADGARYWTAVADDVETYNNRLVRQMQRGSNLAANSILKGSEWATWGIKQGGAYVKNISGPPAAVGDGEEMSPRMRRRVDQARRMSAVAKLLSRTVLKGAISATGHVANFLGTAISGTPPVQAFMSSDARREIVVASVNAFAQVVEAVETAGKSLATATNTVGTDLVQHKWGGEASQVAQDGMGTVENMIDSVWTLNKLGLYMLWRASTASTALYNRSCTTSRSTSTTSDVRVHRPTSVNTVLQPPLPIGRTVSTDEAPQTAELFPRTPDCSQPQYSAIAPPNLYMHHQSPMMQVTPQACAAYYQTQNYQTQNPMSQFQHFARPGIPPQVQPFFPHTTEAPKRQ